MSLTIHLLTVLCVAIIASGQILFKLAANALAASGTIWHVSVLSFTAGAIAVYGFASLLWIALLQHAPLSRLYPYFALSFVLVSGAGWLLFKEQVSAGQTAGLALIVLGLIVISTSS